MRETKTYVGWSVSFAREKMPEMLVNINYDDWVFAIALAYIINSL
jgi:hypothetical protein